MIVCLCGSVKNEPYFKLVNIRETLRGNIVLQPLFSTVQSYRNGLETLRGVHRDKIKLADEVIVIRIDGYIGDDTKDEIAFAESLGKPVLYAENGADPERSASYVSAIRCPDEYHVHPFIRCQRIRLHPLKHHAEDTSGRQYEW